MSTFSKIAKKIKHVTTLRNVLAMATGNPVEQLRIIKELAKKKK
jgi:hypothetical protein